MSKIIFFLLNKFISIRRWKWRKNGTAYRYAQRQPRKGRGFFCWNFSSFFFILAKMFTLLSLTRAPLKPPGKILLRGVSGWRIVHYLGPHDAGRQQSLGPDCCRNSQIHMQSFTTERSGEWHAGPSATRGLCDTPGWVMFGVSLGSMLLLYIYIYIYTRRNRKKKSKSKIIIWKKSWKSEEIKINLKMLNIILYQWI